jgi:hypothetical protein
MDIQGRAVASACAALLFLCAASRIHPRTVEVSADSRAGDQAVDPSTLEGKVLFGYQGWFGCPGAWGGSWSHWSGGTPTGTNIQVEMYPDYGDFNKADLCQVGALTIGGTPSYFYSARNPNVVDVHFRWMREYGLDGVLIQRFLVDIPGLKRAGDVVLKNILQASLKHGRVVAIEYDVTGAGFSTWSRDLQADWKYLVEDLKVTGQANYLKHKGRPLVSVWGMGLNEARNPPLLPGDAKALVDWFHAGAPATQRASVMGGVPAGFRTLNRDARPDTGWLAAYRAMDAVQPWNVGRYNTLTQAKTTYRTTAIADQKWLAAAGVLYMPVAFPGYSQSNATRGLKPRNEIPRLGGDFIWQQALSAKLSGAGALKIAMFDEVNEATAMFKVVSKRSQSPAQGYWLALDGDGADLPSDWYLRLSHEITKVAHGVQPPTDAIPINPKDPFTVAAAPSASAPGSVPALQWVRSPAGIRFRFGNGNGTLTLHDARGRVSRVLSLAGGEAIWDYCDHSGRRVAKGLYLARAGGGKPGPIVPSLVIPIH